MSKKMQYIVAPGESCILLTMNKVTVWFIVGFLVLVTAGVIITGAMSGGSTSNPNANFVATTAPAISASDWTQGPSNAKVSLIEYGDFQCPACSEYYPIVTQLLQNYGDKVQFVFRNFPLYTIHPDAGISAQAAGAAGLQGKFFDMYSLLYKNQATWSLALPSAVVSQDFDGYAKSIGLDMKKFDADINSPTVAAKISADVTGGNSAQINHTPTFFVNLKQIPNPTSYNDFKATIEAALGLTSPASSSAAAPSPTGNITLPDVIVKTSSTPAKSPTPAGAY